MKFDRSIFNILKKYDILIEKRSMCSEYDDLMSILLYRTKNNKIVNFVSFIENLYFF